MIQKIINWFKTYPDFWETYKQAHYFKLTRYCHTAATLIAVWFVINGIVKSEIWVAIAGIFAAYAISWASHLLVEGNSPLSLKNPLFSIISDFRMSWLILTLRNPI